MSEYAVFLDIIRKDHERIGGLFVNLLATQAGDKKRRDLFGDLRREITLHSMLEEELLYPRLKKQPALKMLVAASSTAHASADRLITLLEKEPTTSKDWIKTLRRLHDDFCEHMQIEEQELRTLLPVLFTVQEMTAVTVRLRSMRAA